MEEFIPFAKVYAPLLVFVYICCGALVLIWAKEAFKERLTVLLRIAIFIFWPVLFVSFLIAIWVKLIVAIILLIVNDD